MSTEYTIHELDRMDRVAKYYVAYPPSMELESVMPFLRAETKEGLQKLINMVKESPISRTVEEWNEYFALNGEKNEPRSTQN